MDLGLSPPDRKPMRHNHDIINPGKKSRELLEYYSGNCSELLDKIATLLEGLLEMPAKISM